MHSQSGCWILQLQYCLLLSFTLFMFVRLASMLATDTDRHDEHGRLLTNSQSTKCAFAGPNTKLM